MNAKRYSIFHNACRIFLSLWLGVAPLAMAQDEGASSPYDAPDNYVGEAGKAIFERVFGPKEGGSDIDYYAVDLSNHSRGASAVRSTLVPGWGQVYNGQRVKGYVMFFAIGASAVGSALLYQKSKESYSDYEATGLQNSSIYDDYESERTQSVVLGSIAVGLYLFGIFDAARNAYQPLMSARQEGFFIAANDEGPSLVWRGRFK